MNDRYSASLRLKVLEKIINDIRKDGLRVGITNDDKLFVQNTIVEPNTEYGYAQSKFPLEVCDDHDTLFGIGQIVYHPTYYISCTDLSIVQNKYDIYPKSYRITNIYRETYEACSSDNKETITFTRDDINKTIFLSSEEAKKFHNKI